MNVKDASLTIGFVTYNPGLAFYERLKWLADAGYATYVFDNSPETRATRACCDSFTNVHYATAGNNVGLGVGLSVITATAYYDGYPMLLFFDQDTCFTAETLQFIAGFSGAHPREILEKYVTVVFDARQNAAQQIYQVEDVMLAISSGSLFMLENFKKIGWHNPRYFVDCVDYEMCLRARNKGYRIGKCSNTPGFDHESEQPDRFVSIFNKRLPLRRYAGVRIKDSTSAYLRLIAFTLRRFDWRAAGVMSRSFLIFLLGQVLSRTVLRKAV
ncbi:MAG: hypothetical protein AB7F79_07165 [Steroidobacteraceae bacterium]